ncbi:hypothetical protein LTR36_002401 [Oleoguttula mirabilis]|uniref:DUF7730 domain-containing protein n=1 Tax=Oleoguttula mirabilis TaxID=1507867 RepID=A0AAV9JK43_9PEZI|nr:hypothetical protein LTR36_002401 [Oleoguttula mirabilis]
MSHKSLFRLFFELPPELRNAIYNVHFAAHAKAGHMVVRAPAMNAPLQHSSNASIASIDCAEGSICTNTACTLRHPPADADPTNVLLVCKRMYVEAIGLFVESNTFLFQTPEDLLAFDFFAEASRQTLPEQHLGGTQAVLKGAVRSIILAGRNHDSLERSGTRTAGSTAQELLSIAGRTLPALQRIEIRLASSLPRRMNAARWYGLFGLDSPGPTASARLYTHLELFDIMGLVGVLRQHAQDYRRLTAVRVRDMEGDEMQQGIEEGEMREEAMRDGEHDTILRLLRRVQFALWRYALGARLEDLDLVNDAMGLAVMRERV